MNKNKPVSIKEVYKCYQYLLKKYGKALADKEIVSTYPTFFKDIYKETEYSE